jgi:hypothetical protein
VVFLIEELQIFVKMPRFRRRDAHDQRGGGLGWATVGPIADNAPCIAALQWQWRREKGPETPLCRLPKRPGFMPSTEIITTGRSGARRFRANIRGDGCGAGVRQTDFRNRLLLD